MDLRRDDHIPMHKSFWGHVEFDHGFIHLINQYGRIDSPNRSCRNGKLSVEINKGDVVDLFELFHLQFPGNIAAVDIGAVNFSSIKIEDIPRLADHPFDILFFAGEKVKIHRVDIADVHIFAREYHNAVSLHELGIEI